MADAGRQVAFRQHGVISVAVDGLGQTQRDLSTIGKAGAQAQMQMTQQGMQASKILDQRSKASFDQLKQDMKSAEKTAAEGRQAALSALQASASLPPPEPTPAFEAKFPDVAKEQAQQLNAMKANMAEFRTSMAEAGVDVGDAATMQEDMSATMGGTPEDRKMGQAVLDNILKKQQQIGKELKGRQQLNKENIKELKRQHKLKDDEVKSAQLERKRVKEAHCVDSKQFAKVNAETNKLERERRKLARTLKVE